MPVAPLSRTTRCLVALVATLGLAGCGSSGEPAQLAFVAEPESYGDDVLLDLYWEACETASGLACDTLWRIAPVGSAYEAFAANCGGRGPALSCEPAAELASSSAGRLE